MLYVPTKILLNESPVSDGEICREYIEIQIGFSCLPKPELREWFDLDKPDKHDKPIATFTRSNQNGNPRHFYLTIPIYKHYCGLWKCFRFGWGLGPMIYSQY